MPSIDQTYKKRVALFKKLYAYDNGTYDPQLGASLYDESVLSADEQAFMAEIGWTANELVTLEHDRLIEAIAELGRDERLNEDRLAGEFVAAVGGSYRRGANGPVSLRFARLAPPHEYRRARKLLACGVCGHSEHALGRPITLSRIRESLWLGYSWHSPEGIYADLSERVDLPPVMPTAEDADALKRLLEALSRAEPDETPGKLEKRLSAEKVLRGNGGTRRSLLDVLAWLGVIPNMGLDMERGVWTDYEDIIEAGMEFDTTQGRSDLEMPWAGWRGRLGVDWERAKTCFGPYL
ncbi:hypothetical protein [Saccharibacillus brassicae]|uniref:Uncharacterized protein n=1 Tax=Saccharibacillus brassicae TaxID=2583377 RepID=A0A4Y6URA8_SACBS|nr:hypothetical protein [Saccharibacillus brassicae]QDH20183.1 hypothetical protein FFV09_04505 [Saccharibacillus brassicae]